MPQSANFWFVAAVLPLPGSVPDMKAQSADYIRLQEVYRAKARSDQREVLAHVRKLEEMIGKVRAIDEQEIDAFCKGAASVRLIRGRPSHVAGGKAGISWGNRARFAGKSPTSVKISC